MATALPTPRVANSRTQTQATNRPSLALVTGKGQNLPNRYGIGAIEKWGKTSLMAQFPGVVFIESKGETGLETLIDAGQLPETPHFPECEDWLTLLGYVDALLTEDHSFKTVAVDTLNGCEALCHDYTRVTDCDGSREKFQAYGRGVEIATGYWREFLAKLDRLRVERKMRVVMAYHMKVKNFKNPEGADYDRYVPELAEATWGLTRKWLDVMLFGKFETQTIGVRENAQTGQQKGKALSQQTRLLCAQPSAAYPAGNRIGLPEEIEMGNSPAEAWANFMAAVKAGREVNNNVQQ